MALGTRTFGRMCIDYSGSMGQSRVNNDFGRGHEAYASRGRVKEVTNKKQGTTKKRSRIRIIPLLHEKLQNSLLETAWTTTKKVGQQFDAALQRQEDIKQEKMELLLEKKLDDKGSDFLRIFICGINGIMRNAGIVKQKPTSNTIHSPVSVQN